MKAGYRQKIADRIQILSALKDHPLALDTAVEWMVASLQAGGKILVFGNGGSAAQASHLASELVNRFRRERRGLPAIAFTVDGSSITSIANDSDFRFVFSRQVEALGKPGDIAIALTTSGSSPNIIQAISVAAQQGLRTIALCGETGGPLRQAGAELLLQVPSSDTPIIQEMHLFLLHFLAGAVEEQLAIPPGS